MILIHTFRDLKTATEEALELWQLPNSIRNVELSCRLVGPEVNAQLF